MKRRPALLVSLLLLALATASAALADPWPRPRPRPPDGDRRAPPPPPSRSWPRWSQGRPVRRLLPLRLRRLARHDEDPRRPVALGPRLHRDRGAQPARPEGDPRAGGQGAEERRERKVGAYYASCMDEAKIEELGVKPLEPMLKEIATVKDGASLMTVAGKMQA